VFYVYFLKVVNLQILKKDKLERKNSTDDVRDDQMEDYEEEEMRTE
jgi:hypothetical protein